MNKTPHYETYVQLLKNELIPAMGCTEPVAIALAAAKAREALGALPESCLVEVSGNIVKNVKGAGVPNTGGLKGIEAAAAAGIVAGRPDLDLEVIARITPEQQPDIKHFLERCRFTVRLGGGDRVFYIKVTVEGGGHTAHCEIMDFHTNITSIMRDDQVLHKLETCDGVKCDQSGVETLSVKEIVEFADIVDLDDVREVIGRQIAYNSAISEEGLRGEWGAQVGKTLMELGGEDSVFIRAKAAAAAGSDARMSGCELPVIIVSGSGNQGITTSMPVIVFARDMGASEEELMRALVVASLITLHQKTSIGRLSAFCGAVSAGAGAACGVAYLRGGRFDVIAHTLITALGICSGMVCDGAKPSCAAKIAASVEAGLLSYQMYTQGGRRLMGGDGILSDDVEQTIANVGRMASQGMRRTDQEILDIMVGG